MRRRLRFSSISYTDKDNKGDANGGKYTISKNSEISFGDFPHAGEYVYTVKETKGTDQGIIPQIPIP